MMTHHFHITTWYVVEHLDLHVRAWPAGDQLKFPLQLTDGQVLRELFLALESTAGWRNVYIYPAFGDNNQISGIHFCILKFDWKKWIVEFVYVFTMKGRGCGWWFAGHRHLM